MCRHAPALVTIKSDIYFQRYRLQTSFWYLIKNFVGIEWAIVTSHTCVITPHHKVGATKILSEQSVQQSFPWSSISHFNWITSLYCRTWHKVVFYQSIDSINSNIRWNIPRFKCTKHLVDQQPITYLNSNFCQMFMTAMHWITRLESSDGRPAFLFK